MEILNLNPTNSPATLGRAMPKKEGAIMNIIKEYNNKETGMTSYITENSLTNEPEFYQVSVQDVDSGLFLNRVLSYRNINKAINKAKEVLTC